MGEEAAIGGISALTGGIFNFFSQKEAAKAQNKANETALKIAQTNAKSQQFSALFGSNQNKVVFIVLGLFIVIGLLIYFLNKK